MLWSRTGSVRDHNIRAIRHTHLLMCGFIHSSNRICVVGITVGLRQWAVITDFVGRHAPHVFLAPVSVGLPSVGPVEAVGSVVAGVDPQDGLGESLAV